MQDLVLVEAGTEILKMPGLFQCSMQSQRDSSSGANARERYGMGRDHLWHRGGDILQVTHKDGNLLELLLPQLSSSYLHILRTNIPAVTQLLFSFSIPLAYSSTQHVAALSPVQIKDVVPNVSRSCLVQQPPLPAPCFHLFLCQVFPGVDRAEDFRKLFHL